MTAILTWLASLLTGPVISGLTDAYKAKLASVNSTDQKAVDLALADLNAQIEARKISASLAGTRLGVVQELFGLVTFGFFSKVVVYDKMLGWGSTDPITGDMGTVFMLVISFYFGGPIVSGVVNRVTSRFGR